MGYKKTSKPFIQYFILHIWGLSSPKGLIIKTLKLQHTDKVPGPFLYNLLRQQKHLIPPPYFSGFNLCGHVSNSERQESCQALLSLTITRVLVVVNALLHPLNICVFAGRDDINLAQ